jgi:hypothetical protein
MPILKHPNSDRISPGAMTTHMWGAAVIICPVDSATAGGCPPSRKSSAKPTLNVKTDFEDVMPHNLRSMWCHNRNVPLDAGGSGKLTFVTVNNGADTGLRSTAPSVYRAVSLLIV